MRFYKLKGGALYIAITISILISVVLSLFILLAYFSIRSVQSNQLFNQLELSVESGFELSKSQYFNDNEFYNWKKMPYNSDSISIKQLTWGCFKLISVEAKNKHHSLRKCGLFGTASTPDTALIVANLNKPIGLSGKIKFGSNCYFPKAGIKSAYVDGTSFSELNLLRPFVKDAPAYIPSIDANFLKNINTMQDELNIYYDSLISFLPEKLNQPFYRKTVVLQQHALQLKNCVLKNNIKVVVSNELVVENTCQLENVLFIARKIVFKKGFKGVVHCIAKDTVLVEDECEFQYPSSFVVYDNIGKEAPYGLNGIFFGESCMFQGALLAVNNNKGDRKSIISFNKNFTFIGSAYCNNYCNIQGNIYGTIVCESLLLQMHSAVYENHLHNAVLNPKKYCFALALSNWFDMKNSNYKCAKWL